MSRPVPAAADVPPVFDAVVGQDAVVRQLAAAAAAAAAFGDDRPDEMTHAWLFTGPPGSGRSVAARAFAAALQCPTGGCGVCHSCTTVLAGTHPDVTVVVPEGLHLKIAEVRAVVAGAARAPSQGRWQVTLLEDADRIEERTSNTLLKALEEPPPRGVFLLCAPSADDLLPTVRSRCRLVGLRTPPADAVAAVLQRRHGVDPAMAAFAARAAQGHIGRAQRLALDEQARLRRREVLAVPAAVGSVPACFVAAANLVEAAKADSEAVTAPRDAAEAARLREALGDAGAGRVRPRASTAALKELEDQQRSRATRAQRDVLDRALVDLAGFYRDVLMVQVGAGEPAVPLGNVDVTELVASVAAASTPEATLRRIEAVLAARAAVAANVAPLLAVEAMALALHAG